MTSDGTEGVTVRFTHTRCTCIWRPRTTAEKDADTGHAYGVVDVYDPHCRAKHPPA